MAYTNQGGQNSSTLIRVISYLLTIYVLLICKSDLQVRPFFLSVIRLRSTSCRPVVFIPGMQLPE